jgi:hypothetical protein
MLTQTYAVIKQEMFYKSSQFVPSFIAMLRKEI